MTIEERVACVEVSVENIHANVQRLEVKVDRLDNKIDAVKDSVAHLALSTEQSFAALKVGRALDKVWWLVIAGALLGVMARGFQWI